MQTPILHHAPVVQKWGRNFKEVFANGPEYQHFKNYITGLMASERKNFSQIANCMVKGSDASNISRFMDNALWSGSELNDKRVEFMLERTKKCDSNDPSYLILDDTLDEHVGTLFEHIARHYDHCDSSYKLAQNPVTSHYVRGSVSFPLELFAYRTYDEVTDWEIHFRKNFPEVVVPKTSKDRNKIKKKYEKQLLSKDLEFAQKHAAFKTKIRLAINLVDDAINRKADFSVVLFDSWYLAPDLIAVIEKYQKAWISILKVNRKLETASLKICDINGKKILFEESEIKVEQLVPQIPKTAYQKIFINDDTSYWAFSFNAQIPTLGKVRIVISFDNAECIGTYAVLVTQKISWDATKIIRTYCCCFQIEVFYKDAKQLLGFSDYQCRTEQAIQKHWYLVLCAYSFLRLDLLLSPAYQTWQRQLKTVGVALRRQAQAVIEQLLLACHRILSGVPNAHKLFKLLFPKLVELP